MFPIRAVQGEVIGFGGRVLDGGEPKYLNSPETPVFSKGRELYGLFEARTALRERGYALVVEGYMDVVALAQSGFANAVATLGTACTAEHVQKLFRFTDSVVFSFDGDAAGRRAAGARARGEPAARHRHAHRPLPVPARRARPRQLRARARRGGVRAGRRAAVPLSRQLLAAAARRAATWPPPRAARACSPRPGRCGGAARRRAEAPAAGRARRARRVAVDELSPPGGRRRRAARRRAGARRAGARAPARRARRAGADAPAGRPAPGCCCSKATGGTSLSGRRPRSCSAPCPAGTASCSAASSARRPSTVPQPWAALRERLAGEPLGGDAALALRRRRRIRRSSRARDDLARLARPASRARPERQRRSCAFSAEFEPQDAAAALYNSRLLR